MSPSTLLLFFLFTFIHPLTPNLAQPLDCSSTADYCWQCSDIGNYFAYSIYKTNLDNVILSFPSTEQNNSGFYNLSSGQGSDQVNEIRLCRGDLEPESCEACLNDTNHRILEHCPRKKEAILWGERRLVRYSNI